MEAIDAGADACRHITNSLPARFRVSDKPLSREGADDLSNLGEEKTPYKVPGRLGIRLAPLP